MRMSASPIARCSLSTEAHDAVQESGEHVRRYFGVTPTGTGECCVSSGSGRACSVARSGLLACWASRCHLSASSSQAVLSWSRTALAAITRHCPAQRRYSLVLSENTLAHRALEGDEARGQIALRSIAARCDKRRYPERLGIQVLREPRCALPPARFFDYAVAQLRLLATLVNAPLRFVPTALTAPMITTAMRAASKPYSMAVAPDSSKKKRAIACFIFPLGCVIARGRRGLPGLGAASARKGPYGCEEAVPRLVPYG